MTRVRFTRIAGALLVSGLMLGMTPGMASATGVTHGATGVATGDFSGTIQNPYSCDGVNLSYGSYGECVAVLQMTLNAMYGAGLAEDGSYGRATKAAVKNFQARYGLTQDGKCGPQTWRELTWRYYLWEHGQAY